MNRPKGDLVATPSRRGKIAAGAICLEVAGCTVAPSPQYNARPVLLFEVRNSGTIDAPRPFSIHIYEPGKSGTAHLSTLIISQHQLPKLGKSITITLPVKGWNFESRILYVATKYRRKFIIHIDPEFVYGDTMVSSRQILIEFSLYDVFLPLFQHQNRESTDFPDAYFFLFTTPGMPTHTHSKIFPLIGIKEAPDNGGSGGTGGGGDSDIDWAKPFIETAKWFRSFFESTEDDKVRDFISRLTHTEIQQLSDDQLVDMIKKLFDGPTLDEDESAINKILSSLPPDRFGKVVARLGGLSAIDDEIDGAEWEATLKIAAEKGQRLPLQEKLALIKGLFDTSTEDAEERAIINLVKSMSPEERWQMLRKPGFSKDDFDDDVDGDEWDELEKLLDEDPPQIQFGADGAIPEKYLDKLDEAITLAYKLNTKKEFLQVFNKVMHDFVEKTGTFNPLSYRQALDSVVLNLADTSNNPTVQKEINRAFDAASKDAEYEIEPAFILPNGNIYIYKWALKKLSPRQLAGLIVHEVAHYAGSIFPDTGAMVFFEFRLLELEDVGYRRDYIHASHYIGPDVMMHVLF